MRSPAPPLAKPTLPWLGLGLGAIAAATLAKLYLIGAGPDLEADGYGHALAARQLLERPTDLGVHWVWLPLGHFVSALSLLLGAGMDGMRYLNCALTSLLALGVACSIERDRALRWTSAAVVALSPLALSTGESGALEPLFATLVLASAWALRSGHARSAGIAASFAALSRYEGWLLAPVFFWIWWRSGRARAGIWTWLCPLATIGAYTGLRASINGGALVFLDENAAFAGAFFANVAARWPVPPHASWMSIWYALIVPALMLGPLMPFALAGSPWLVRRGPRPLTGALLAILVFLTIGFVARQHLGLPRHALTLLPIYAMAAAAGLLAAARWLHRRLAVERIGLERWTQLFAAAMLTVFAATRTLPTLLDRSTQHRHTYREELAVASALRAAWSPRVRAFCDVTPVETLSDLPPASFVRWQLPDTPLRNLALEHAAGRDVLVVGTEVRARHLLENLREVQRAGRLVLYRYFPTDPAVAGGSNVKDSL
jgi:hypothetical protein